MNNNRFSALVLFIALSLGVSCKSKNKQVLVAKEEVSKKDQKSFSPNIEVREFKKNDLTKDFITYWTYHSQYIKLFKNFLPLNPHGDMITKSNFLKELSKGIYFPLLRNTADSVWQYQLTTLPKNLLKEAGPVIADYSNHQLSNYYKEQKPIPNFKFKDLIGVEYSSKNTKGKIVVLKCWFIACAACVAEMPALNRMVEKYKDRKDILFLSLASDDSASLKSFLKTTEFAYHVIPSQDDFMSRQLKVYAYPTHILIDRTGKVFKIVTEGSDLEDLLAKMK